MSSHKGFLARHARRIAAVAVVVPLYWLAELPETSAGERAQIAQRFHFTRHELPDVSTRPHRATRPVHPSLEHIAGWINTLGASVALADLDRDGLPDDVVWVDTRTDEVLVACAPGTTQRYAPFVLDFAPLPYDRATMAPMRVRACDVN